MAFLWYNEEDVARLRSEKTNFKIKLRYMHCPIYSTYTGHTAASTCIVIFAAMFLLCIY